MKNRSIVALKVVGFLAALVPLARLVVKGFTVGLGANPIEVITRSTGLWTLTFLMTALAITPLRKLTGLTWLIRFRRMVGLFAFFYGCLHLTTYVWLDQFFDIHSMAKDVVKRPFITAGFTAWLMMLPLALTSTAWAIRRLGGGRWRVLHRLVYVAALAGVVHFWWLVKRDLTQPEIYAWIFGGLMAYRVASWLSGRQRRRPASDVAEPVVAD